MPSKKLTELTEVTTLGTGSLVYIVDPNRSAGDQSVGIDKDNLATEIGATGALTLQTAITTSQNLTSTEKGLNDIYPVTSSSAVVLTVQTGTWAANDIANFYRGGSGTVEFVAGTNVRIYGERDVDNRHFIRNKDAYVSLICLGLNGSVLEFQLMGAKDLGYTGAVTTSSYTELKEGDTAVTVTVTGTGFSSNMEDPVATGNATINSWAYVSSTQITLNMTATGVATDQITITYRNPDEFVDTNAITLAAAATYNDYIAWWKLDETSGTTANEESTVYNGTYNGSPLLNQTGQIGVCVDLDGTDDYISVGSPVITAFPFSVKFWVNADTLAFWCISTGDADANYDGFNVALLSDGKIQFFVGDGAGAGSSNRKLYQSAASAVTTGTWYQIIITMADINTPKLYLNSVDTSIPTNTGTGTTGDFSNNMRMGQDVSGSSFSNGKLDDIAVWDRVLTQTEVTDIYTLENAGSEML